MTKFVLTDVVVMFKGRDISGDLNSVSLEYSAETPDSTAFGDTTRRHLPGVLDVVANHAGWWDSVDANDSLDADLFGEIGALSSHMSLSPDGGQLGEIAFSFPTVSGEYNPGASHGEVYAFTIVMNGTGILVRGEVVENGVFTATANGTTNTTLGAAASTDTIYSVVHVVAASGTTPTLDVTVESAVTDFATVTTRLTHPQFTAVGVDRQSLVGPVTDTFWRMVMTITGGSPSFTIFGLIGIQPTVLP